MSKHNTDHLTDAAFDEFMRLTTPEEIAVFFDRDDIWDCGGDDDFWEFRGRW